MPHPRGEDARIRAPLTVRRKTLKKQLSGQHFPPGD
jgi:hypothetical protein